MRVSVLFILINDRSLEARLLFLRLSNPFLTFDSSLSISSLQLIFIDVQP